MRRVARWPGFFFGALVLMLAPGSLSGQTNEKTKQSCKEANTQLEMNQCSAAGFHKADSELNMLYASARKKLAAADSAKLQEAQRAWLKYRDANCDAETSLYEGGSIQPAIRAGCLERTTRARIAELHAVYETGDR